MAQHRFEHHKNCNLTSIAFQLQNCYENGAPKYNDLVAKKYSEEHAKLQHELSQKIQNCGAITDINQIKKDIANKKPILITGSSQKHWPKISDENKLKIQIALDVLIHSIDTDKVYLVTGGTNHGVEKEAHILANKFNNNGGNIIILGTLTEEAMNTDTNSIEPNTITHAIIPTLNGKPAKRWFDLPDTVLNMVGEQDGTIVAIGGGPIVSDMIQRSHNLRLDLNIMSDVEGASGDKSRFFNGNNYDFGDAKDLVLKLLSKAKGFIKQDITSEKLDEMIEKSYKRLTAGEDEKVVNKNEEKITLKTKALKLTSLDPNKYPDTEVECLVIDNMKEFVELYIKKLKEKGEYPKQAQKSTFVTARPGVIGEIVDTRPRISRNGNIYTIGETKNQVKIEGSMIVKSPDGEEYIVTSDTFAKKYKQTSKEGVYEPMAEPITYITLNHDIVFKAPWGEEIYAAKGAVLNISDLNNVYAIQNEAFKNTYSQNVLNNDGFQK